jgi:hypothetical protein
MTGLPEAEFDGRWRRAWPSSSAELSFPHLAAGSCFHSSPQNPRVSGISATEARWRAFTYPDGLWLGRGGISSLAGAYSMLKTRLQLTIFSRIPYLYKALRNARENHGKTASRQSIASPETSYRLRACLDR